MNNDARKDFWKKPTTLQIPQPILDALDESRKKIGHGKQKWAAVTAAILLWLEQPRHVQEHYAGQALAADATGDAGFLALIERTMKGELRKEAAKRHVRGTGGGEGSEGQDDLPEAMLPDRRRPRPPRRHSAPPRRAG